MKAKEQVQVRGIALVTGASSGLGWEFCRQLDSYDEVSEFWLVARREERLLSLEQKLQTPVRRFALDLTEPASYECLAQALAATERPILYLVNSAGYGKIGEFCKLAPEDNLGILELNGLAMLRLTQMVLPYMARGGCVFNIASVAAFLPQPEFAVYAASKAFVLSWSRALAQEKAQRSRKIRVLAVCPNPMETEFFQVAAERKQQAKTIKSIGIESVEHVVKIALRRASQGWQVSTSSPWAKLIHLASKLLPTRAILFLERTLLRMYK